MAVAGDTPARREHRMPRDESLTAAPHIDTPTEFLELLTVEDVAALLKVSKSWVYEHTRARNAPRSEQLPHVEIGKYVRFDPRSCAHLSIVRCPDAIARAALQWPASYSTKSQREERDSR